MEKNFVDGKELLMLDLEHLDELPGRIKELLAKEKWERMATRGYEKALRQHTWLQRAKKYWNGLKRIKNGGGEAMMEEHQKTVHTKCRICGDESEHKVYRVREMFFGTGQEFVYFECDKCQCLQILEIPENLGDFYGEGYYSFNRPDIKEPTISERINTKILDVGCGAGRWLAERYAEGCVNLSGCDPFIENDISYGSCIHIKKKTIHEMDGLYDLIMLQDSFEHMGDPLETLISVERLLNETGICVISTPVFPNAVYDVLGVNWYQWDAPRHLFLHSVNSMKHLCQRAGLRIQNIVFDSGIRQFTASFLYQEGIPYIRQNVDMVKDKFSLEELESFEEFTAELNQNRYGDHAVFVIIKDRR